MNRGDRIIFLVCSAILFYFYTQAVYQYGVTHGKASCKPLPGLTTPKKPVGYEMSKRQLRRMIRYEQAKGGVL